MVSNLTPFFTKYCFVLARKFANECFQLKLLKKYDYYVQFHLLWRYNGNFCTMKCWLYPTKKKTVLLKEWSVSKRNAQKEIDFTACNPSNCALYYFHSLRSLLFALRTLLQGRIHGFKKKSLNTKWGLISLFQVSFFINFRYIPHENKMLLSR